MKRQVALAAAFVAAAVLWQQAEGQQSPATAKTQTRPAATASAPITLEEAQRHYARGLAIQRQGKFDEAIEEYRIATRAGSTCAEAFNHFAWLRATNPDPKRRDGQEAVRLSERACKLGVGEQPTMDAANLLDTLAAAYAEAGRFDDAVATAKKAADMARSLGSRGSADEFESRQRLYENKQPFREEHPLGSTPPRATSRRGPRSRPAP